MVRDSEWSDTLANHVHGTSTFTLQKRKKHFVKFFWNKNFDAGKKIIYFLTKGKKCRWGDCETTKTSRCLLPTSCQKGRIRCQTCWKARANFEYGSWSLWIWRRFERFKVSYIWFKKYKILYGLDPVISERSEGAFMQNSILSDTWCISDKP